MSEEYGSDFIVITDEEGNEYELEFLSTIEVGEDTYMAFLPADNDEDGEELLVSADDDDEADRIFQIVMERVEDMYDDAGE